jgi:hypothetical protein
MPGDHTPISPVEDYTGVNRLPQMPAYGPQYQQWQHDPYRRPSVFTAISRESWVRIVLWVIPIIFTAGALYVSVQSMTQRQDEQESVLRAEMDRRARLESEQRVMQSTVQGMSEQQGRLVIKVEAIDDKLNEQKSQLSAIGERLGARPAGRDR